MGESWGQRANRLANERDQDRAERAEQRGSRNGGWRGAGGRGRNDPLTDKQVTDADITRAIKGGAVTRQAIMRQIGAVRPSDKGKIERRVTSRLARAGLDPDTGKKKT